MVQYAKEHAEILPAGFEENLDRLFQNMFTDSDRALQALREMINELESVIKNADSGNSN